MKASSDLRWTEISGLLVRFRVSGPPSLKPSTSTLRIQGLRKRVFKVLGLGSRVEYSGRRTKTVGGVRSGYTSYNHSCATHNTISSYNPAYYFAKSFCKANRQANDSLSTGLFVDVGISAFFGVRAMGGVLGLQSKHRVEGLGSILGFWV